MLFYASMINLLNLQLPHPIEKPYQVARRLLYEVLEESSLDADKSDYPLTPAQLEVVGVGRERILSLHFLDQHFKGNISKLEQICGLPESTQKEKEDKAKHLIGELKEFDVIKSPPVTVVYEFLMESGIVRRVSEYGGDFTAGGWRWEAERRTFDKQKLELKKFLPLAKNGYRRAKQAQEEIVSYLKTPDLLLQEQDFYNFYLSSLKNIADRMAMRRFVESVLRKDK